MEGSIKKKKRPGKQARERMKAGLPVRAVSSKPKLEAGEEWPETLSEQWLKCGDCAKEFGWPVEEQELFKSRGFGYVKPTRCSACRKAKKQKYGEAGDAPLRCYNWCRRAFQTRGRSLEPSQGCALEAGVGVVLFDVC
jgi:hypothetical protein